MNGNSHESPARRGGRPRKPEDEKLGVQIALRMDSALVARLDQQMERLRRREPAVVWSRGSAIRWLMLEALAIAENGGDGASTVADELTPRANDGELSYGMFPPRLRADEVLAAVRELEGAHARPVHAAQVRQRLPNMPRSFLDTALVMLEKRGFLELSPPSNPSDARERQGVVHHHPRGPLAWIRTKLPPPALASSVMTGGAGTKPK
jgi:hypothetical protein